MNAKPLRVLDPEKLTVDELKALRHDGFDVEYQLALMRQLGQSMLVPYMDAIAGNVPRAHGSGVW